MSNSGGKNVSCSNSFKKKMPVVPRVEVLMQDGQGEPSLGGVRKSFLGATRLGGKETRGY